MGRTGQGFFLPRRRTFLFCCGSIVVNNWEGQMNQFDLSAGKTDWGAYDRPVPPAPPGRYTARVPDLAPETIEGITKVVFDLELLDAPPGFSKYMRYVRVSNK